VDDYVIHKRYKLNIEECMRPIAKINQSFSVNVCPLKIHTMMLEFAYIKVESLMDIIPFFEKYSMMYHRHLIEHLIEVRATEMLKKYAFIFTFITTDNLNRPHDLSREDIDTTVPNGYHFRNEIRFFKTSTIGTPLRAAPQEMSHNPETPQGPMPINDIGPLYAIPASTSLVNDPMGLFGIADNMSAASPTYSDNQAASLRDPDSYTLETSTASTEKITIDDNGTSAPSASDSEAPRDYGESDSEAPRGYGVSPKNKYSAAGSKKQSRWNTYVSIAPAIPENDIIIGFYTETLKFKLRTKIPKGVSVEDRRLIPTGSACQTIKRSKLIAIMAKLGILPQKNSGINIKSHCDSIKNELLRREEARTDGLRWFYLTGV
jgi:hypothetical protein